MTLEEITATPMKLSDKVTVSKSEVIHVNFWNDKRFIVHQLEGANNVTVYKRYIKNKTLWKEVGTSKSVKNAINAIRRGRYNGQCRDDRG
jgi:hypothetical protein